MRYIRKIETVYAIQFQCNTDCINELKIFMGPSFVGVTRDNQFSAAKLLIDFNGSRTSITEGDFIVRKENGQIVGMSAAIFNNDYEQQEVKIDESQ